MPFVTLNEEAIVKSVDTMVDNIEKANIIFFAGGFSAADEPDGSAKFIVNILLNEKVHAAIDHFIEGGGLISVSVTDSKLLSNQVFFHTVTLKMQAARVQPSSTMMPTNTWLRWLKHVLPTRTRHGLPEWKLATSMPSQYHTVKVNLS